MKKEKLFRGKTTEKRPKREGRVPVDTYIVIRSQETLNYKQS